MSAPVERALRDVTLFPLWLDNPAAPTPERPLIGRSEADLVIVGGGFTGLWAAIQAKEADPGRDVVLIEAAKVARPGLAAAGGSDSNILRGTPHHHRAFVGGLTG
jgi:monoamine oxidase